MVGGDVTVLRPRETGRDPMNCAVVEWVPERVGGCLWSFGTADASPGRPNGARNTVSVHFPKTYSKPLRGCRIEVAGHTFEVAGDPMPLMGANCPTPWHMCAEGVEVVG